jgi:hypothetical protein
VLTGLPGRYLLITGKVSLVPLRKKFTSRGDPETEGRRGAS